MPESSLHVAVVGAGVLGRLCALRAAAAGARVTLFDSGHADAARACTRVGAGMLAPVCELEHADDATARLGLDSSARWERVCVEFGLDIERQQAGSLVVAHAGDSAELGLLRRRVAQAAWTQGHWEEADNARVRQLEPGLETRFPRGLFFPGEGHVSNDAVLTETTRALRAHRRITWLEGVTVHRVAPREVGLASASLRFDVVLDCRGLGAREDWSALRGVRGEVAHLHAPEVTLNRPVRLMHPRYPIYIVPRKHGRFVIGATQIESDDDGPATLRSALELLSAAYTVHPGFAEARLVEFRTGCRPALPHNQPRLRVQPGLIEANGLYRHGFLLSPVFSEAAAALATGQPCPPDVAAFVEGA